MNTELHKVSLIDGVADERMANRLAERVVPVSGKPTLLVSEADFRYALTMRHIEALECDGQKIPQALIDLELFCKLSSNDLELFCKLSGNDLGLIESKVFLLTLAAEARCGNLTEAEFEAMFLVRT